MPTLPLPPGSVSIAGGDLPVTSAADILAVLPSFLKPSDPAPVRDALIAAFVQMMLTYQERSGYAAAQSDVLRAIGVYEDGLGFDRGEPRQVNETNDTTYRARILSIPALVTPAAILAIANTLLAPYTAILPQYCEANVDCWFVRNQATIIPPGQRGYSSFVFKNVASASPLYLDRLYKDDSVANGGVIRPQSNPGGARVWGDPLGRSFLLRIPDLSPLDASIAAAYRNSTSTVPPKSGGMFVGAGSAGNTTFIRKVGTTASAVYQSIANAVERIKGASVRWTLYVDPKLTS